MAMSDRQFCALFVAPIIAPMVAIVWLPEGGVFTLVFGMLAGFGGMLIIGVPIFLMLRSTRWRAWWVAISAGFFSGMVMWFAALALVVLSLDETPSLHEMIANSPSREGAIWPGGVTGAIVGLVFWLIARPDREV